LMLARNDRCAGEVRVLVLILETGRGYDTDAIVVLKGNYVVGKN